MPSAVQAATAINDAASTNEDVAVTIRVLDNDSGSGLKVASVTASSNGTAVILDESAGTIRYTPASNWNGTDTFTYTVMEGSTLASAAVTVTVTAVNDAPSFTKGTNQMVLEDCGSQTVSGWATSMSAGPPDEFSQILSFVVTNDNSTLFNLQPAVNPVTGTLIYSPLPNKSGSATVTVRLRDNGGIENNGANTSPMQTFTIVVTPVNDAPAGITLSSNSIAENAVAGTQVGYFVTQDVDNTLGFVYTLSGTDAGAFAMMNTNYLVTSRSLDFETKNTYTLHVRTTDYGGLSYERDFAITVTNVNEAPVAANDSYVPTEDVAMSILAPGVLANDVDVDSSVLTARLVSGPAHGSLTLNADGSFAYTPGPDYSGPDSFAYEAWDGALAGAPATVTLTVVSANDAPSFTKGADQAVLEDCGAQTVSGWATSMSAGPEDESVQALDFNVTNDNTTLFSTQPALAANGTLTYTLAADANGTATVTVIIHDNGGTTNGGVDASAPQTFTITATPVNDVPVNTAAPSISGTMNVGDTLTADPGTWNDTIDTSVSGTSTLTTTYQWVHADDASGTNAVDIASATSSTYVLSDADSHRYLRVRVTCTDGGVGLPVTQSATPLLTPWTQVNNRLPVVTEGASTSVTIDEDGSPLGWNLTLHAADADSDTLTWSVPSGASHGTATANGTSLSTSVEYTPTADYNGSDSFVIRVDDGWSGTDDITVNVIVREVNDAPTAVDDAFPMLEDGTLTLTTAQLLSNDLKGPANESGQNLMLLGAGTVPVNCTITLNAGTITVYPSPNSNGTASFGYTIQDDGTTAGAPDAKTASGTVTITVNPVNDVPSFTKGADQTVAEDCSAQSVAEWATNISAGPADEAGQVLHFDVTNDNNALFSVQPAVSPTGILTYTPAANMNGSATVTLTLTDDATRGGAALTTAAQTFTITVTPVNDPPVNTAVPVISGIPHVGRTLATTDGVWNDLIDTSVSGTSALSYAYQWQRSTDGGTIFADIPGAIGPTYILTLADNLQLVRSKVTCTDDGVGLPLHQTTSELSTPVSVTILNAAPVITEGASVSTACDEDESPVAFTFTLHATDSDAVDTLTWHILTSPAHGTLILPAPSVGSSTVPSAYHPAANWNGTDTFTLQVEDGLTGTDEITMTVVVIPRNDAPVNTVRPSIAGSLFVNNEVGAVNGSWNDAIDTDISGTSVLSYTYQWLRAHDATRTGLALIPGATASSYVVPPIDEGMYLAVRVTCTDSGVGLPETMSTTVDSAFLPARYLDMMLPTVELPDFSSWPGVTGWSGGTAPSFTVDRTAFDLQFMVEDDRSSVQWTVVVNGMEASSSVGTGTINRFVSLTEGTNRVDIIAVDQAGNRAERHLTIILDTQAPEVTLAGSLQSMVTGTTLNVEGTIADDVSGVRSLTIDGTEVIPYLDGTFKVSLPLKRGLNTIAVETLDNAGNRGSLTWVVDLTSVQQPRAGRRIDLTIDKKVMVVDGASVTTDVAPIIRESRTLLPLRALVEEVGGSIAWNAKTRQVTVKTRGVTMVLTIGKNTATVNGKSILIDATNKKVVPIILGGRTFLPVRFIAEQLGLGVAWDAPTRMVTITWEP